VRGFITDAGSWRAGVVRDQTVAAPGMRGGRRVLDDGQATKDCATTSRHGGGAERGHGSLAVFEGFTSFAELDGVTPLDQHSDVDASPPLVPFNERSLQPQRRGAVIASALSIRRMLCSTTSASRGVTQKQCLLGWLVVVGQPSRILLRLPANPKLVRTLPQRPRGSRSAPLDFRFAAHATSTQLLRHASAAAYPSPHHHTTRSPDPNPASPKILFSRKHHPRAGVTNNRIPREFGEFPIFHAISTSRRYQWSPTTGREFRGAAKFAAGKCEWLA
jgi:hypothetical protein